MEHDEAFASALRTFLESTRPAEPARQEIRIVDVTLSPGEITVTAEVSGDESLPLEVSVEGRDLKLAFDGGASGTSVRLPDAVLAPKARATLRNGILDVVLPRPQEPRAPGTLGESA
ncbi:MAG TPA: Hsp20/alpha crystallin family protein [Candidatus Thermoplasmatota archaeon]|nr:Hsp20/alpha crystallin family protein [Candidatus Thermoplasmatota archaeon]